MRPNFRAGQIIACQCVLETIPRSSLVAAIVRHVTILPIQSEAIVSQHEHDGRRFSLETGPERKTTAIRLA